MSESLGLIAGDGCFPAEVARVARGRGRSVVAFAFHGLTEPGLAAQVDRLHWLELGELEVLLDLMRKAELHSAVLAGKVPKTRLIQTGASLRLDARARRLLSGLSDRADDRRNPIQG